LHSNETDAIIVLEKYVKLEMGFQMRVSQYILPGKISRVTTSPVYSQIYSQLKRELALGKYKPGQRFYSYRKLKSIYGVELRTVGAAIDLLTKDGLLEKRAASGIYVADIKQLKGNIPEIGNIWYVVMGEQLSHPFYFNILQGIENEGNRYGLRIIVGIKNGIEEFNQWFQPQPGEGLIVTGEVTRELLIEAAKKCNDNIIVIGNYSFNGNFGRVSTNYYGALQKSLKMAIDYGCQRIGVVSGPMSRMISGDLLQAAEDCKALHPDQVESVSSYANMEEDGFQAMTELAPFKPDCILVTEPGFPGIWEYMTLNNLKCPEDIFVIRFGKEAEGLWYPNLATINLESNSLKHGVMALQMLLEDSKNVLKVEVEIVKPERRIRDSKA
jgi:DNA-binding LacI/PurR family transcriptional regulator